MTIQEEAKKLRRRIPKFVRGQKRRFSKKLRVAVLDWIDRAKSQGLHDAECSRLIGLSSPTFNAWRVSLQPPPPFDLPMDWRVEPINRELVPIAVPPGIELTSGVVVVSPRGYRVEGLNLEQAYALLREFS